MTNRRTAALQIPWYVGLIPASYVLNLWVESGVSVLASLRSLGVAALATVLLVAVLTLVMRNVHRAGIAGLLAVVLLTSRGPVYLIGILVIAGASALVVVLIGRIRKRRVRLPELTRGINIIAMVIVGVVLSGGLVRGTYGTLLRDLDQGASQVAPVAAPFASSDPDILVLLLDAYPRADWVRDLYGGDNQAFIDALDDRGFEVVPSSQANYIFTELTLTSMFQNQPLDEIAKLEPAFRGHVAGQPLLRDLLNDGRVFELLREHGYRVVASNPGYEHVALRRADVFLDDGTLNDFELHLLRSTLLEQLVRTAAPTFFADQQRARIASGFNYFRDAAAHPGPTFGFIHIPAPHVPVVFERDGSQAPLPPSGDIHGEHPADRLGHAEYLAQLEFVNRSVLDAVDETCASGGERECIVVVMSDHGSSPRPETFEAAGSPEHHANLIAIRLPDDRVQVPSDLTTINVLPLILNAYLGADLSTWPDHPYAWGTAR